MNPEPLAPNQSTAVCDPAGRLPIAFGRRFLLLMAIGMIWAIPAFWDIRYIGFMAGWDAIIAIAWIIDLWRLPSPSQLAISRRWTGPLSLNNDTKILCELQNKSRVDLYCRIIDDVPGSLCREPPQILLNAPARDSGTCS